MTKTTDELEVEGIEDMLRDGISPTFCLFALWNLGERGNQIAHDRVREILWQLIRERRDNQQTNLPPLNQIEERKNHTDSKD